MTEILRRPDGPWRGLWQGAVGTALTMGPIVLVRALFARESDLGLWDRLGLMLMIVAGMALVCGVVLALWRMLQCWAYDRYIGGSFH